MSSSRVSTFFLFTVMFIAPPINSDQAAGQSHELTPQQQELLAQTEAAAEALRDPAFERFVSLSDLDAACQSLNVDELIDGTLQLAYGERVLLRPHNSGITPGDLLKYAASAAARLRQPQHFERLRSAAQAIDLDALVPTLEVAAKLARQPRATSDILEDLASIRFTIDRAELQHDLGALKALAENLPEELTADQRSAVRERIQQAQTNIRQQEPNESIEKLTAPSRFPSPGFFISLHSFNSIGEESRQRVRKLYVEWQFPVWAWSPSGVRIRIDNPPALRVNQFHNRRNASWSHQYRVSPYRTRTTLIVRVTFYYANGAFKNVSQHHTIYP